MVEIRYPPPTRNISPQWHGLKAGTIIQRIFDPTSYGGSATGFRYYGPLSRFDHQRCDPVSVSSDRGIMYAGLNLSCCLVEVFGDNETIKIQKQQIAVIKLKQSLKLLDLRDAGAWNAGCVAAVVSDGRRKITQAWSRYFYDNSELYGQVDGLIFNNAHNQEEAISLYERATPQLSSADVSIIDLNDSAIRETILAIANKLNLIVEIEP